MPRKLTNKQIVDGINKAAENYFKASNAVGLSKDTEKYLTGVWAHFREMAVLLAQKNPKSLEDIVSMSSHWVKLAGEAEAEATSHPMGQS